GRFRAAVWLALATMVLACVLVPRVAAGASADSFSFGAAGDFGANNNSTATLSLMGQSNLDFGLMLGDMSYDQLTPESAWCDYVHQNVGTLPIELISGNHESDGAQGLIDDFGQCLPNQMSDM